MPILTSRNKVLLYQDEEEGWKEDGWREPDIQGRHGGEETEDEEGALY